MHTPTKLNPFDIDKAIEELTSYRDGLKQQLELGYLYPNKLYSVLLLTLLRNSQLYVF